MTAPSYIASLGFRIDTLLRCGVFVLLFTLIPVSQVAAQICTPPPAGLVSWWPLDETRGTTAADIVDVNDGSVNGATMGAAGEVASAASFDGFNDFINVPIAANMNLASGSIEAWVRPTLNTETVDVFLSFADGSANGFDFLSLAIQDNGQFLLLHADSGVFRYVATTNIGFTLNQFHHVVFTVDGSGNQLYVDGASQPLTHFIGSATNTEFLDDIFAQLVSFTIGKANINNFQRHFSGEIDEVSLYDRALTPGEIQAIYNAGTAGKCKATIRINDATNVVNGLVLDPSTTAMLVQKLREAQDKFDLGDLTDARSKVSTFVDEVEAAVNSGSLSKDDANLLLKKAGTILGEITFP